MYYLDDPEEMSPEKRLREVAAILALGYLRLKKQTPYLPELLSGASQETNRRNNSQDKTVL